MAKGYNGLHTSSESDCKHWKFHINEVHVLTEPIGCDATICLLKEAIWGVQGGFQKIRVQRAGSIVDNPDDEQAFF